MAMGPHWGLTDWSIFGHISYHLLKHQAPTEDGWNFKRWLRNFWSINMKMKSQFSLSDVSDKIVWVSFTAASSLIWARPEPQDWAWHNGGWPRGCGGTRLWPQRSGVSTPGPWPGPSSLPPSRRGWASSRCILTRSVSARPVLIYRSSFGVVLPKPFWQFSWEFDTKIKGLIFAWIRLGTLLISGVISLILSITLAAGGDRCE